MLKKIILLLSLSTLLFSDSNITEEIISPYVKKEFLIVKSTTSYKEAKKYSENISKKLNIKIDFRGLSFHKKDFLSFSKEVCSEFGEVSCYLGRGRYDDGEYISIEHTNYYDEFTNGYYIVVVATGEDVSKSLKRVKKNISDAYVKSVEVYMGCIH